MGSKGSKLSFEAFRLLPTDWQILQRLRVAALLDSSGIYGDLTEEQAQPEAYWRQLLVEQNWIALRSQSNEIGIVCLTQSTPERYGDCWIKSWWISPQFRGAGGSAVLLAWIDQFCIEQNWQVQALGVFESNQAAIATYSKLGFKPVGIRNPTSRNPDEFYVVLARRAKSD